MLKITEGSMSKPEEKPLTDHQKKAWGRFIKAERTTLRKKRGCLMSYLVSVMKLLLLISFCFGAYHFVMWWHPWETVVMTKEVGPPICDNHGYVESRKVLLFKVIPLDTSESTICVD